MTVLRLVLFLLPISLSTLAAEPPITFEKIMTSEEMQASGISSLAPTQRAQQSSRAGLTKRSDYSYSTGSGHWIESTSANGAIIVLEDGSMWEINSLDTIDAALWLPVTNITVLNSTSPIGDYKYVLVNTEDGEKALAKYMGRK